MNGMEAIRTKDKLFLAVVVPAAAVAAYVLLWRADAVKRIETLSRERASLVTVEDFPAERTLAERRLAAAREELAAEERIPMPAVRVKADPAEGVAARERAVLEVFRQAGLIVTSSAATAVESVAGGEVLKRTGTRPAPVCRAYAIDGRYPGLVAALRTMAGREMAVIPERVEMVRPGHWSVVLWL